MRISGLVVAGVMSAVLASGVHGGSLRQPDWSWVAPASQVSQWMHRYDDPRQGFWLVSPQESFDKYISYDFSSLLSPKTPILGYLGDDYQRLRITLKSIVRDPQDAGRYLVTGMSSVKGNSNTFSGEIIVNSIREFANMHYGDEDPKEAGIRREGIFFGHYVLREDSAQAHSGMFEGLVTLYWYVAKDGKLRYDDTWDFADGYNNNQYVGTWTSYKTHVIKTANWGEYRIPFSDDLDVGAGEFGPNRKYWDKGWADYVPCYEAGCS